MNITPQEIIDFWYSDRIKKQWFSSTPELDKEILDKYGALWEVASNGELDAWSDLPEGNLALVIVLDQFPLNMFRGQAKSFKSERKAVETALKAINKNFDERIARDKLAFLYMPLMHSEIVAEQDLSLKLFREKNLDANIRFAEHHSEIVRQFGRFPHRNEILGRKSTEEEIEYLASKNGYKG
jgi:uncharacterized protein (DUF924 family)